MTSLRRKPQEENIRRFSNLVGFPLKFTQLPIYWHHNIGRSPIDFWWWAEVVNNIVLYGEIQNATLRKYVPRFSLLV